MKAYKGFNTDMTCRGFQFEEGKTYEENEAKLCESGFHACENPLDCFNYYEPGSSVYHEVELEATEETNADDSKRCGKKITIGARLDIAGICKAHFEYVKERCVETGENTAGDCGSAAAGNRGSAAAGYRGSAAAGDYGSAAAGENGVACCRGGKVKGGIRAVLAISELDDFGNNIAAKAVIVDGVNVKSDTWYTLKNGKLVEVE